MNEVQTERWGAGFKCKYVGKSERRQTGKKAASDCISMRLKTTKLSAEFVKLKYLSGQ